MSQFDRYIEDYLLYHFRNIPDDSVPRDFDTESRLMRTSKCEYFLQQLHKEEKLETELGIAQSSSPEDKVQYKITRLGVVYNNSLHRRLSSIFDAFDITCNAANVRLPLLELHCKLNNLDCINAADALYEKYKNEMDIMISGNSRLSEPQSQYRQSVDETYHNWNDLNMTVLVKYINDKKIILPIFLEELSLRDANHFCFWPTFTNGATPLYSNAAISNEDDAPIILTEEFELVAFNQRILNNSRISDIEWRCYLPQTEAQLIPNQVASIDWSKLKNRNVYYLLKGGSGTTRDISLKRARVVESKLDGIVKEFKYVSLFTNISETPTPDTGIGIPVVLSPEELAATLKNKYQQQRIPLTSDSFAQHQISFGQKGELLLAPVIRERSISVLYGNEYSCRSWFALCIAFFISQGQKFIEGWTTGKLATPALYLYGGNPSDTDFGDKLNMVKAIYAGRAEAAAQRYKRKEHMPGINANKVHPINNKFYGEVIDHTAKDTIEQQISLFEERFPHQNRLLFLDNLFSASNRYTLASIRALLARLTKRDWAIIIVDAHEANPKKSNIGTYRKELALNNLIKIDNAITKNMTKSQMSIKLRTKYKLEPDIDLEFKCELDTVSEPPTFRRLKHLSPVWGKAYMMRRGKLNKKIIKLHDDGHKGKAIAEKLGISLSLVKKIKTELELSTRRTPKLIYSHSTSQKQ